MQFRTILAAVVAVFTMASTPAHAYLFSSIYAFGDSLSDNGQSLTATALGVAPPAASSNGPVAVEFLATAYGIPLYDYAVGGATSGQTNTDYVSGDPLYNTGVLAQVATFLTDLGPNSADSAALYMVSGGANDLLADPDPVTNAVALGQTIAQNLASAVSDLYAAGARHFLLPLLPDIGLSPYALSQGAGAASGMSTLVDLLNQGLSDAFSQLLASLPDATFTVFDTAGAQRAVISDPAGHGLTDVTTPCVDANGAPTAACATSFFLDELHPTSAASQLLAVDIRNAIPEPGSAMLTLLALAAAVSLRRRQAA